MPGTSSRCFEGNGALIELVDREKWKQIDNLRVDLAIRPEQERAWLNFVEQFKKLPRLRSFHEADFKVLELPRVLEREAQALRFRLMVIAVLRPAIEALYATLSPRQRMRADRILRAHCMAERIEDHAIERFPRPNLPLARSRPFHGSRISDRLAGEPERLMQLEGAG